MAEQRSPEVLQLLSRQYPFLLTPVKRINNDKFYFYICCNLKLQQKNSDIYSLRNESVLSFDLLNNLLVLRCSATEGESMLILKQLSLAVRQGGVIY